MISVVYYLFGKNGSVFSELFDYLGVKKTLDGKGNSIKGFLRKIICESYVFHRLQIVLVFRQ